MPNLRANPAVQNASAAAAARSSARPSSVDMTSRVRSAAIRNAATAITAAVFTVQSRAMLGSESIVILGWLVRVCERPVPPRENGGDPRPRHGSEDRG